MKKKARVLFERFTTPRPQQQQQREGTSESASVRSWKQSARNLVKEEPKEDAGNPTEDSETSRSWKQNCEKDLSVEEEPEFKADFRVEGIAHVVIFEG